MHQGRAGRERGRRDRLLDGVPRPLDPREIVCGDVRHAGAEKNARGDTEQGAGRGARTRASARQHGREAKHDEREQRQAESRVGTEEEALPDTGGADDGRHESPRVAACNRRPDRRAQESDGERPPPFPGEAVGRGVAVRGPAVREIFGRQDTVAEAPQQRTVAIRAPFAKKRAPPLPRLRDLQTRGLPGCGADRPAADIGLPVVVGRSPENHPRRLSAERAQRKMRRAREHAENAEADRETAGARQDRTRSFRSRARGGDRDEEEHEPGIGPQQGDEGGGGSEQDCRPETSAGGQDEARGDEKRESDGHGLTRHAVRAIAESRTCQDPAQKEQGRERSESSGERNCRRGNSEEDPSRVEQKEPTVLSCIRAGVWQRRTQVQEVSGLREVRGIGGVVRKDARRDPLAQDIEIGARHRDAGIGPECADEQERSEQDERETRQGAVEDAPRHRFSSSDSGRPPKAPEDMSSRTSPGRASRRRISGIIAIESGAKAGLPADAKRATRAAAVELVVGAEALRVEDRGDDEGVGRGEGVGVVVLEHLAARRVRARLEERPQATPGKARAGGRDGPAHGGRVVGEVVDDEDPVLLALDLHAALHALEPRERAADLADREAEAADERDRAEGVADVVAAGERGGEARRGQARLEQRELRALGARTRCRARRSRRPGPRAKRARRRRAPPTRARRRADRRRSRRRRRPRARGARPCGRPRSPTRGPGRGRRGRTRCCRRRGAWARSGGTSARGRRTPRCTRRPRGRRARRVRAGSRCRGCASRRRREIRDRARRRAAATRSAPRSWSCRASR